MVLSTCSPYFRSLFATVPHHLHPVVFLKDVEVRIVELLLRYMYSGQVSVVGERLVPLVQAAKSLRIKGLLDVPVPSSAAPMESAVSAPPPPAVSHNNKSLPVNSSRVLSQSQHPPSSVPVKKPKMMKPKVVSNSQNQRGGAYRDPLSVTVSVPEFHSGEARQSPATREPPAMRNGPLKERLVYPVISVDDDTRLVGSPMENIHLDNLRAVHNIFKEPKSTLKL